jgi:hypothetical protein
MTYRPFQHLRVALCAAACLSLAAPAVAGTKTYGNDSITKAGDILRFALPAAAGGISLTKGDYVGIEELGFSWTATVGTTYLLSHVIHERRPDGSDYHSFPSNSAASAYAGADYLWGRYGWKYGVPAYAVAMFVGYSRVQAKQHHWYDVMASSAIAAGINWGFTTRYHPRQSPYSLSVAPMDDGAALQFAMRF